MKIFIDPKAILFLIGTEMDFVHEKLGARFVFNNPNQTAACGCGESVSITPVAGRLMRAKRFDDLFIEFGPIKLALLRRRGHLCRRRHDRHGVRRRIYFKTDEETRKAFAAEKTKPFSFMKGGERVVTTWFALPDRLYDDPEELARWARAALQVAKAAPAAKKTKTKNY